VAQARCKDGFATSQCRHWGGGDPRHAGLPGVQSDLLQALKDTGKPLVVLIYGRAMSIKWIAENADAVLDAYYPGEAGGTAVADALCGDCTPGAS
jgi:beta-glucosidase